MEKEMLLKLKVMIEAKEKVDAEIKAKKEAFEETLKAERLIQENYENEINQLKAELSEKAIKNFEETKSKTFIGGIKVQEAKKLNYDEKIAFDWAKEKQMFLQFDKKGFEKAATSLNLEFVEETTTLRATFPSKIEV